MSRLPTRLPPLRAAQEKTSKYAQRIDAMMDARGHRLVVNLNDLRESNKDLAIGVLTKPFDYIPLLEQAVREAVLNKAPGYFTGAWCGGRGGEHRAGAGERSARNGARPHAGCYSRALPSRRRCCSGGPVAVRAGGQVLQGARGL